MMSLFFFIIGYCLTATIWSFFRVGSPFYIHFIFLLFISAGYLVVRRRNGED